MAKQELIKELPSNIEERKRVGKVLEEALELTQQIKDLQESLKTIYQVEKEDHSYDPKMLKSYVKLEYSRRRDAEKVQANLEEMLERDNELNILFGRSE